MVDIWGFGARANDLISWFFFPGVPAAEQVRRQKIRSAFLELMRSVKESDILLFAASVDTIGNNLEVALPSRDPTNPFAPRSFPPHAFDVVGGAEYKLAELAKRVEAEKAKAVEQIEKGDYELVEPEKNSEGIFAR